MKKLLLLLILSFFSAQGYAGSCPDGRVDKSGTIVANFLYNPCSEGDCGGAKNFPVSGSIEGLELTGKFILGNGPDFNEIIFELEAN